MNTDKAFALLGKFSSMTLGHRCASHRRKTRTTGFPVRQNLIDLGCGNLCRLVGSSGLEPPTSRLSGARSNHLSYEPIQFPSVYLVHLSPLVTSVTGGDDGVRTHDPLLAGQVLSQLSYTPMFWGSL